MCPLCVVATAVGLSVARYYGVDDSVTGLWLGALAVSTAMWINIIVKNRMHKAKVKPIPFQNIIVFVAVVVATIVPFYYAGFFNGMPNMSDTLFGVNRLVIGTVIGGFITLISPSVSNFIKRRRNAVFPYQTILLTLVLLTFLSLFFWYFTRYVI